MKCGRTIMNAKLGDKICGMNMRVVCIKCLEHCKQIQPVADEHVAVCMTHQQSTTNCATEWMHQSKWEQCGMVKCSCFRRTIHPNRTDEQSFSSMVLRVVSEQKFTGECNAVWNLLRPSCCHQEKVSGSQGVSCCAPCTGRHYCVASICSALSIKWKTHCRFRLNEVINVAVT